MSGVEVHVTDASGQVVTLVSQTADQSLMELARSQAVAGIVGDCGGACACATCHVYVAAAWQDKVGEADSVEDMMLDMVDSVRRDGSRLSCQIRLTPDLHGLAVEVAPQP